MTGGGGCGVMTGGCGVMSGRGGCVGDVVVGDSAVGAGEGCPDRSASATASAARKPTAATTSKVLVFLRTLRKIRGRPRASQSMEPAPWLPCEHTFVTSQGSAYMRFRRALDRGSVTDALSAASELQFVGLAEALELTLLLADGEDEKYERAALRWHARFAYETKKVDIRESVAVLALLTAIPANRFAAAALAELFSRRRSLERCAEALVRWARTA